MESFSYGALPSPTSIRLLTLFPAANPAGDALECSLDTHDNMDRIPAYEALSYVWGSDIRSKALICNGQTMSITDSLDVALRRLRLRRPRVLWIDQICINQDDLAERSSQVQMMRDIFMEARRVIMWLGPDPDGQADKANSLLETMTHLLVSLPEPDLGLPCFPKDSKLAELGLPLRDSPAWEDLDFMIHLPYFRRAWIVQEVRVAAEAVLLWGGTEILWVDFRHGCKWAYLNRLYAYDPVGPESTPALSVPHIMVLFEGLKRSPWTLMARSGRGYQTRDPRDQIFAFLGIVDNEPPMVVDYRMSTAKVYAYAVRHIITATKVLDILSFAFFTPAGSQHGSPNWALEWDSTAALAIDLTNHDFTASRDSHAEMADGPNWEVLTLKGLLLTSVDEVSPVLDNAPNSELKALVRNIVAAFAVLRNEHSQVKARYEDTGSAILPFVATLTLGSVLSDQGYPESSQDHATQLRLFLSLLWNQILVDLIRAQASREPPENFDCPRSFMELAELALEVFPEREVHDMETPVENPWARLLDFMEPTIHESHADGGTAERASRSLRQCASVHSSGDVTAANILFRYMSCMGRRFFRAHDGSIGMGHMSLQPGDVICALFGGKTLYALRPTSTPDEYLYIGECYVHGYMHGEAMDRYEAGELVSRFFHMR